MKKVEDWTAKDFSEWFLEGIKHWQKGWPAAFFPFNYQIGRKENLIEDLVDLYHWFGLMRGDKQKKFSVGLKMALQKQKSRELLYLAKELKLSDVVFSVVNKWINSDLSSFNKDFLAIVLNVVCEMSSVDGRMSDILRKIVRKRRIRPQIAEFAPMIFIALCRTEPEKWVEHLSLLRKELAGAKGPAQITAHRFAECVHSDVIAKNLWRIRPEDKWLIKALFTEKNAPLQIIK